MEEIKIYKIIWSPTFKNELDNICSYISEGLKEPKIAKKFYLKIIEQLNSLKIFPERYVSMKVNNITFRKLLWKNYVIIYKINFRTREVFILNIFNWNKNYLFSI